MAKITVKAIPQKSGDILLEEIWEKQRMDSNNQNEIIKKAYCSYMRCKEDAIKAALIKMGWRPPDYDIDNVMSDMGL